MTRHAIRPTMRAIIGSTLMLAFVGTAAHAQFGGLIKKAAERAAAKKVQEATEDESPAKPLGGDPVTASALDAVLAGLAVEAQSAEKSSALLATIQAKDKEFTDAKKAAGDEPDKWRNATSKVNDCVGRAVSELSEKHQEEATQKLMTLGADPSAGPLIEKMTAVGKRMADANARNDKAGYMKAFEEYIKLLGIDPAKDTVAAYAKCGRPPAKPASMVRIDQLSAEIDGLQEQRRAVESERMAAAAKAAGIPAEQYALARERLLTWNVERAEKGAKLSVTKDEDALFKSRLADIQKFKAVLQ